MMSLRDELRNSVISFNNCLDRMNLAAWLEVDGGWI